jgi:lipoprotein-releasing system ATP-binding protein
MDIRVENLQKVYVLDHGVEVRALKGVSVGIKTGETVAIVGPSGAGKSTLLHLLGLMDRPTGGAIYFDDRDVGTFSDDAYARTRREKIGFLFQMHYLLPDFTVWENVVIPVWEKRGEKAAEARQLLERLGLGARLEHMPSELSGGEAQRAALARALINNPELLMADEPTGNLDRETGEKVEDILFEECGRRNITLVIVTHNPDLARRAGRLLTMRDGVLAL